MSVLPEVLKANEAYAANFGAKSQLALPPARRFAILTCMDARLDPAKYAGLSGLLEKSLETATIDDKGWHDHGHGSGSVHGHYVSVG
jgi:carbonic anhydrase